MLRTSIASGSAFLVAKLLDVRCAICFVALDGDGALGIFFSFLSVDTLIFFSLAFAGTSLPWVTWAIGDFCAKILMILVLLYPFRLLAGIYRPTPQSFG
ncbi:hypothetical protein ACMAY5_11975 [Arenicellales bacterium nBUS_48]|jgi:queuosine precursor transporter